MPFFDLHQNNSFGVFDRNETVRQNVIVEADNEKEAEEKMSQIVNSYWPTRGDCPCCGDRWYISFWNDEGTAEPSYYSTPVAIIEEGNTDDADVVIYYKDGTKKFGITM